MEERWGNQDGRDGERVMALCIVRLLRVSVEASSFLSELSMAFTPPRPTEHASPVGRS